MSAAKQNRIGPSDMSPEQLKSLFQVVEGGSRPVLIDASGKQVEMPQALRGLFLTVAEAMRREEAVYLMAENEALTTQAAADFLGVSRQYLVRLLDSGKIASHRVGSHRRVIFKDLFKYRQERSALRKAALDWMTEEAVEGGVYDRDAPLGRGEPDR